MTEDRQLLFEKYIADQLTDAERADFESQLSSDASFNEDFELFQSMQQFLDDKIQHGDALETLRNIGNQQRQEGQKSNVVPIKRNRRRAFMMAASIAFLLSFGGYFVIKNMEKVEAPSFAELSIEPLWPINRGDEGDSILIEMTSLVFENKETEAIRFLKASNLNPDQKSLWLAEMFVRTSQPDSVLKYVSLSKLNSSRASYLRITSLFATKKYSLVVKAIDKLSSSHKLIYQKTYDTLYQFSKDNEAQN